MRWRNVLLVSALALSACSPFRTSQSPAEAARESVPDVPPYWAMAREEVGEVAVDWIASFNDPTLTALVVEALESNRDLRAAAANVERANALAGQARADLFPAVDVTASAGEGGRVRDSSTRSYSAGLQLSWEADVWGRVRGSNRQAVANAFSAEADYVFSQYSIAAAVAQSYFLAIEALLQEEVSQQSLEALIETVRIVNAQRELGAASGLDVFLSDSNLANAEAARAQAEGNRRQAIRSLEVLLGRYPAADLAVPRALPGLPQLPSAGLPSTLLERRPDLIAREFDIAAAFGGVESARAARLPVISISGSTSGSGSSFSDALDVDTAVWNLAANLLGPLFDAGLRRSRVDQATAEQRAAIENYASAALTAFEEVETSIDLNRILARRETSLDRAASDFLEAFRLSSLRYQEGETDLLDVLQIQTDAFNAQSNLVAIRREQLIEWINLNLALGGSWTAEP